VGQDGDEELVPLLQAQLVDADVGDDPLGVRLLGPGVGQLVADDQPDRLRRDAQPPGDFLLVAADEQPQDLLLDAVGGAGVPPLEGGQQVLAVGAVGAAVEGGLVGPEAGLAPDVQVPDDLSGVLDLDVGIFLSTAAVAAAAVRPGPGDLEAVAVTVPLVGGDGNARGQIDVDGDAGHVRPRRASGSIEPVPPSERHPPSNVYPSRCKSAPSVSSGARSRTVRTALEIGGNRTAPV